MNEENRNVKLNLDELSEVAGGGGKKGYDTVNCPYCGAGKEVRYEPGKTVTCSACGKQFKL